MFKKPDMTLTCNLLDVRLPPNRSLRRSRNLITACSDHVRSTCPSRRSGRRHTCLISGSRNRPKLEWRHEAFPLDKQPDE